MTKSTRNSEEKYKILYENTPLCFQSLNEDGTFKDVNPAWLRTLGYKSDEVIGNNFKDFLHPKWKSQFQENFSKFKKRGYIKDVEFKIQHKNGHYLDVSFEGCIGYRPDGSFEQTYCIFQDITEQKKAQTELQKITNTLQLAEEISQVGSWDWNFNTNETWWSDGLFKIYGRKKESGPPSTENDKWLNTIHPKDRKKLQSAVNSAINKKGVYEVEYRLIRESDKAIRMAHAKGRVLNDENGNPEKLIGTVQDITKKKEAQYHSTFLSNAVLELIQFETPEEVYSYTVNKLFELLSESVVVTAVEYDNPNKKWKMLEVKGINSFIENGLKKIGIDIRNFEGDINTRFLADVEKGKLVELEFDLQALTNGEISDSLNNAVKKLMGIKELLIVPIKKEETIYGTVTLIVTQSSTRINRQLIEAFISQVSVFIEKLIIENELKENENKLKAAEKIAHVGNYEIDINTGKAIWSEETFRIFGLKYEKGRELTASEYGELVHPDDNKKLYEHFEECISEVKTFNLVYRIIRSDNEIRYVHSIGELETNEKGIPIKMFGTFQDITQQKKAEEALAESNQFNQDIINSAQQGIVVYDKNLLIKVWNPFMEKLAGKLADEVIGKHPAKLFPFLVTSGTIEKIKKVLKGAQKQTVKFEFELPDGKTGWVLDTNSPLYNYNGEIIGVIGIVQDITDQVISEQKLRESEERFDLAVNAANDGVFDWNLITNEIYFSPKWKSILGYEDNELQNDLSVWEKLTKPEDVERSWKMQQELIAKKRDRFVLEFKMKHKEGHWVDILTKAEAVFDQNNNAIRIVGTNQDISEQKRFESELLQAKQKAEESDRLKTAFLANMSHEIRTPMNGILGFTNILKEPGLTGDEQQSYIEIIHKSGERMLNTVNDIIEFSRIEAGELPEISSNVNIRETLTDMYNFFLPETKLAGLNFVLSENHLKNDFWIKTDRNKLESIFTNLIKNAIKFTKKGSIEFGIDRKDTLLTFYVKDNGVGIPEERIEAIFDRFVQADINLTRGYEGSGLGLAICNAYAKMLGGDIWVESEPGKGSTFYFSIINNPATHIDENIKNKESVDLKENKGKVILVAEDDDTSFYLMEVILSLTNAQIVRTVNGKDTVELCENNPNIDLVIMDIKMPVMDGIETTQQIRKFNKTLPIIAQTAYALEGDREKMLEAGCNDYVSKPIRKNELIEKINVLLKMQ